MVKSTGLSESLGALDKKCRALLLQTCKYMLDVLSPLVTNSCNVSQVVPMISERWVQIISNSGLFSFSSFYLFLLSFAIEVSWAGSIFFKLGGEGGRERKKNNSVPY